MRPSTRRRGYSLVMVLLFLTLYLGLWGMAARQIGTMLRIEQARIRRADRDAAALPAMSALALGVAALEVGYPPTSPYVVGVDSKGKSFTLTYALVTTSPTDSSWSVQVAEAIIQTEPPLDTEQFKQSIPPLP